MAPDPSLIGYRVTPIRSPSVIGYRVTPIRNPAQSGSYILELEVFSEDIPCAVLWYNYGTICMALRCKWYYVWFHAHVLLSAWFAWCLGCLFQGWDVGTLGNTLSGCVTQDPKVGPLEACAIHPTHPVNLVVCKSEP